MSATGPRTLGVRRPRLATFALLAATALALWSASPAASAPLPPGRSGPNALTFACAGRWAPIQAKVSGFVVGNCLGGTTVRGIATDACAPGCIRGARNEGRGWEAVALPRSAGYAGCGWINIANRLDPGRGPRPDDGCDRRDGPDVVLPQAYVKRFTGRRVGGARLPSTAKYRGLYLWAGRFTGGANRGQEGGAIAYRPHFARGPAKTCTAYANVNPTRPGQRVRRSERMWAVHDGSRHLQIRYVARFRARDEQGRLRWWVNAHSTHPSDRDQPWGFVAAECIFEGEAERRPSRVRPGAPRPATPALARIVRHRTEPGDARCGFAPVPFHLVAARRGLTCHEAKAVLRRLRGDHDLAPMACHGPRTVHGWRLRSLVRDPSLAVTRYSRGDRSLDFQRHQFPGNIWCPAPR